MNEAGQVVRTARLLERSLPDRLLALGASADEVLTLEGTALEIWDALREPTTAEAIAERLAARYDAPFEQVAVDVTATLGRLRAAGLLDDVTT